MLSLLIVFFLISIVFSFLCSMWEAVLLSITPSYAEIKYEEGTRIGRHLRSFKVNIDKPLAAILTLNTIAHTVGAIGVGAQASIIWSGTNPLMTGVLVPAAMTIAILILSEIIPKTIGATYWQDLAPFTVESLLLITWLLYPFVWLSQLITQTMKKDMKGSVFSRSDFVAMAEIGARTGVFEQSESKIISSLLRFNKIKAVDIMTPRTVVIAASEDTTIKDFYDSLDGVLRVSRIPIFQRDTKDEITGYILKDELLAALADDRHNDKVGTLKREIIVIPEEFPLPELFDRFLNRREHIALVVDEFGGMAGVVTMEDVIETLLGLEIVDESDKETDMQLLARKNWERRARAHGIIAERAAEHEDEPRT